MRADVPGIRRDDVKIHVENDVLTISGETEKHDETGRTYLHRERRYARLRHTLERAHPRAESGGTAQDA